MKTKKQLLDSFITYEIIRKEGRLIEAGNFLKILPLCNNIQYKIEVRNNEFYDDDWKMVHRVVHSYYADGPTDVELFFDFGTVQINGQNWYDVKERIENA
jgi:hypothetical protein